MKRLTGLLFMLAAVACGQAAKRPKQDECFGMLWVSTGNTSYKCKNGTLVEDEAATDRLREELAKENDHRRALLWLLRTRILSPAEIKEVEGYRIMLFVPAQGGGYDPVELEKRLDDLLLQQFKMRLAAEAARKPCGGRAEKSNDSSAPKN